MKAKLFTILLLFVTSFTLSQPNTPPHKYFIEMNGLDDSLNNTHLFYTYYHYWYINGSSYNNFNIYHFDEKNRKEELLKNNNRYQSLGHTHYDSLTSDLEFVNNNPTEYYLAALFLLNNNEDVKISIYNNSAKIFYAVDPYGRFGIPAGYDMKTNIEYSAQNQNLLYLSSPNGFKNTDLSPDKNTNYLIRSTDGGANWEFLETDFTLASLNKNNGKILLGIKDKKLLLSNNDESLKYKLADSVFSWTDHLVRFHYSSDKQHIYTTALKDSLNYIVMSEDNGYNWKGIVGNKKPLIVSLNSAVPAEVYYSVGQKVYFSNNFGNSFTEYKTFSDSIVGLYKKPNSDVLFVLTSKSLYKSTSNSIERIKTIIDVTGVNDENINSSQINSFELSQNYPNPFNPSTVIKYSIAKSGLVSLKVYDVLGKEIATLVSEVKQAGKYSVEFNAKNLPSGIYFYKLISGSSEVIKKMCLVK